MIWYFMSGSCKLPTRFLLVFFVYVDSHVCTICFCRDCLCKDTYIQRERRARMRYLFTCIVHLWFLCAIYLLWSIFCHLLQVQSIAVDCKPLMWLVWSQTVVEDDPGLEANLLVERMVGAHILLVSEEEYFQLGGVVIHHPTLSPPRMANSSVADEPFLIKRFALVSVTCKFLRIVRFFDEQHLDMLRAHTMVCSCAGAWGIAIRKTEGTRQKASRDTCGWIQLAWHLVGLIFIDPFELEVEANSFHKSVLCSFLSLHFTG